MDIRELNFYYIDTIKKLMVDIFSKEPWNDTWTDEQLHLYVSELINNKNSLSFGLFENNNMIGMALGHIKHWYEGTEYWIDEFGVIPEKQQCGIGAEFLTGIEKALALTGLYVECALKHVDRSERSNSGLVAIDRCKIIRFAFL